MKLSRSHFFFLFAYLLFALLLNSDVAELRGEEPRRAIVAMEMEMTGEWIVPKITGWNYYNKPPLFNWLLVVLFKITGSYSEWVVRLPSVISFLLTALILFRFVKQYVSPASAAYFLLFYLTSVEILFFGTHTGGEIDLFYSLIVIAQVTWMFHHYESGEYLRLFMVSYFLAALGVLTKGLPSVAFQVLTLIPLLVWKKNYRLLFSWQHLAGIATFLIPVVWYFYLYSQKADLPGYLGNLLSEVSQKSANESSVKDIFLNVLNFIPRLIKLLLPWSLMLVFFNKKSWKEIKANSFVSFALLFIVFNIPLYLFTANLRSRYIFMFLPFFCIILSELFLKGGASKKVEHALRVFFGAIILVAAAASLTLVFFHPAAIVADNLAIKSGFLAVAFAIIFFFYQRKKEWWIYIFALTLITGRVAEDLIYFSSLQARSKELGYRKDMEKAIHLTAGSPIHLLGKPVTWPIKFSFAGKNLLDTGLAIPPLFAYQIPYYITRSQKQVLQFDTLPDPKFHYIVFENYTDTSGMETLFRFRDKWREQDLTLVRFRR